MWYMKGKKLVKRVCNVVCVCATLANCLSVQMGITAAPARAVSAVKNMNLSQQLRDIKLPDLSNIGSLKF